MAATPVNLQNLLIGRTLPDAAPGLQVLLSGAQGKSFPAFLIINDGGAADSIFICESQKPRKDDDSGNWDLLTDTDVDRAKYAFEVKPGEKFVFNTNPNPGAAAGVGELWIVSKGNVANTTLRFAKC